MPQSDLLPQKLITPTSSPRFSWLELLQAFFIAALLVQLFASEIDDWWNRPRPGKQVAQSFITSQGQRINYLFYLPQGYGKHNKKWPLLVYLHGGAERGNDLSVLKGYGPPRYADQGNWQPLILVSPQCREGTSWNTNTLLELLAHLDSNFRIASDRISLTGHSLGGIGTWRIGSKVPGQFSSIIPVAGGPPDIDILQLRRMPIWAFHGDRDTLIPVKPTVRAIDTLTKYGNVNAKITVLTNAGHGIDPYDRTDVYDWMLSQKAGNTE